MDCATVRPPAPGSHSGTGDSPCGAHKGNGAGPVVKLRHSHAGVSIVPSGRILVSIADAAKQWLRQPWTNELQRIGNSVVRETAGKGQRRRTGEIRRDSELHLYGVKEGLERGHVAVRYVAAFHRERKSAGGQDGASQNGSSRLRNGRRPRR